jgi:predicted DNA-binding transcriptional regulator AlpA
MSISATRWISESVDQWIGKSVNRWISGSVDQCIGKSVNQRKK